MPWVIPFWDFCTENDNFHGYVNGISGADSERCEWQLPSEELRVPLGPPQTSKPRYTMTFLNVKAPRNQGGGRAAPQDQVEEEETWELSQTPDGQVPEGPAVL